MADTYEVDHKYFTFTAKSTITVIRETFEIVSVLTENDSAEHGEILTSFPSVLYSPTMVLLSIQ